MCRQIRFARTRNAALFGAVDPVGGDDTDDEDDEDELEPVGESGGLELPQAARPTSPTTATAMPATVRRHSPTCPSIAPSFAPQPVVASSAPRLGDARHSSSVSSGTG